MASVTLIRKDYWGEGNVGNIHNFQHFLPTDYKIQKVKVSVLAILDLVREGGRLLGVGGSGNKGKGEKY